MRGFVKITQYLGRYKKHSFKTWKQDIEITKLIPKMFDFADKPIDNKFRKVLRT